MTRIAAAFALSALVLVAAPVSAQAQHRDGGGRDGGGRSGDGGRGGFSGGARSESGSTSVRSGAGDGNRSGGARSARYGYRGGYGYRGAYVGGLFGLGYGLGGGYFGPWNDGYPFYAGSPWFFDYGSGAYGFGRYGPAGYAGGALGEGYPTWRYDADDAGPGPWDRDYGTAYPAARVGAGSGRAGTGTACGQWVWNAGPGRYDWAPGACLPQGSAEPPPGPVTPVEGGLRLPG